MLIEGIAPIASGIATMAAVASAASRRRLVTELFCIMFSFRVYSIFPAVRKRRHEFRSSGGSAACDGSQFGDDCGEFPPQLPTLQRFNPLITKI
jgi:hypothetical protein